MKLKLILILLSLVVFSLSVIISSFSETTLNEGFSFGFGNFHLAILFSVSSLIIISIVLTRSRTSIERFLLSLIFVGGLANLIERLFYGVVHDYWNFFGLWHFNIADVLINVGAIFYILYLIINFDKPIFKLQRESKA